MGFRVYFSKDDYYDSDECNLHITNKNGNVDISISGDSKIYLDYLIKNNDIPMSPERIYNQKKDPYEPYDVKKTIAVAMSALRKNLENTAGV